MFLSANPDKARSAEEIEEMVQKYRPGDNVLPRIQADDETPEERRLNELERRMLEQARELSLRDAGVGAATSTSSHHSRQRSEQPSRRLDTSDRSDRESSRDSRHRSARERTRRAARDEERRQATDSNGMLHPEAPSEGRRRQRSGSQQRSRESSTAGRRRVVEHQASIRSLISSSDVDSQDMEREIEEFARQIQEEGLLDGLDLDNLDLSQNDELSRKITEAYRRRQTQKHRQEQARRNHSSSQPQRLEIAPSSSASRPSSSSNASGRQRAHSANARTPTSTNQTDDRSRPPVTSTHLDVRAGTERRRRRTSSGARSETDPIRPTPAEVRPASRSQTDLSLRPRTSDPSYHRLSVTESRSASMPTGISAGGQLAVGLGLSFGERASASQTQSAAPSSTTEAPPQDAHTSGRSDRPRPDSVLIVPQHPLPSLGMPSSPGHKRTRSQFYQEPSITCSRCGRSHIEYELHYNCAKCTGGHWNICLDCYRTGRGCLHWFGFGYAAFHRWERARTGSNEHLEPPHMLTSNRYLPPRQTPGGADGRRTMTTEDPMRRFQSGMFCARCLAWANECFWRCEVCNEGDWGFCNNCVNQGQSCTHALLPLTYVSSSSQQQQQQHERSPHHTPLASPSASSSAPPSPTSQTPPASPRSPNPPAAATLFTGPNALSIGNFRPLTFTTTCDICRTSIIPTDSRYHCYTCTSTIVPDTQPGDYDVCSTCYNRLITERHVSPENGPAGWRRCLAGHRMVVIGFQEAPGGQKRVILRDLVGGWNLHMESYDNNEGTSSSDPSAPATAGAAASVPPSLQRWWWRRNVSSETLQRLVTRDVAATAPTPSSTIGGGGAQNEEWTTTFPADGGSGLLATAKWSWYPQATAVDELLFPRGAEVAEVEDVNGDWFFGCYMGSMGLFPAPYVRLLE
ncbi:hypothetical protein BX600DRAFT_470856 [Xylariales sp. PMI_506]|nr:hypothetical protein BX600DRAFT_470856 [Xylariales sp. PMI_506]